MNFLTSIILLILILSSKCLYSYENQNLASQTLLKEDKYPIYASNFKLPYSPPGRFIPRRLKMLLLMEEISKKIACESNENIDAMINKMSSELKQNNTFAHIKDSIVSVMSYTLSHTLPNAIDACYVANDIVTFKPLSEVIKNILFKRKNNEDLSSLPDLFIQLQLFIFFDLKNEKLEIILEDNGIGISRKTFEKWKAFFENKSNENYIPSNGHLMQQKKPNKNYLGGLGRGIYNLLYPNDYELNDVLPSQLNKNVQPSIIFQTNFCGTSHEISFPGGTTPFRDYKNISIKSISKKSKGTSVIIQFDLNDKFFKFFNIVPDVFFEMTKILLKSA